MVYSAIQAPFLRSSLQPSYRCTAQSTLSFSTVSKLRFPQILSPRSFSSKLGAPPLILSFRFHTPKPEIANIIPLIVNSRPRSSILEAANAVPLVLNSRPYISKSKVANNIPNGECPKILFFFHTSLIT